MNESMKSFMGFRLIETTAIIKQIQRRTHHKRRINKKWLKRYGYKTILDDRNLYWFAGCIFGTPKAIKKMIEFAESRESCVKCTDKDGKKSNIFIIDELQRITIERRNDESKNP